MMCQDKENQVRASASDLSKHKLDELAGRHAEEPLLKENPGRFVLFPIQDNDVSTCIIHIICFMCSLLCQ